MIKLKNVVSAFDGMSCGQIALNDQNIEYENYYAIEINPYSIKVTQDNYPNTIQLGDIRHVNLDNIDNIDLFMGGSPCTNLSFQNSINDGNFNGLIGESYEEYIRMKNNGCVFNGMSYLFWEYVHIIKTKKPKYFLLENVMMPKKWKDIITKTIGVQPVMINSNRFSPQNRKRLYWTNMPIYGLEEQTCDLVLEDILEKEVDKKYYKTMAGVEGNMKSKFMSRIPLHRNQKSRTLMAGQSGTSIPNIINEEYRHLFDKNVCDLVLTKELYEKIKARNLTPIEHERIQTVPDNYTKAVSDTRRREMIGNGWTVKLISFLLSGMSDSNIKVTTHKHCGLW